MQKDHGISWRAAILARLFQLFYPLLQRLFFSSPELEFATKKIARPTWVQIPTRHGMMRALLFSPTRQDIEAQRSQGRLPPVHLLTHGGAFITRLPREEGNVARYLCSEVGCFVLIPDYLAAPQVRYPVAEQQLFDSLGWIRSEAVAMDWDATRISVGGPSAGGQFALSVALLALESGRYVPVAVTSEYGCADMSRTNAQRTSPKKRPVVGNALMNLVHATYFNGTDLTSPGVSPIFHPMLNRLPPTLILTAEFDTLRHESNDLAAKLQALGVDVTYKQFAGVDHGFTHQKPVATAREAITMIGEHLRKAFQEQYSDHVHATS